LAPSPAAGRRPPPLGAGPLLAWLLADARRRALSPLGLAATGRRPPVLGRHPPPLGLGEYECGQEEGCGSGSSARGSCLLLWVSDGERGRVGKGVGLGP